MADQLTRQQALDLARQWAKRRIPAGPIAVSWDERKRATNKKPLTRHGHNSFTTDLGRLDALFGDAMTVLATGEVYGVGLHPGPGHLVVLDVDVKGGKRGDLRLAEFEAEHGALPAHPIVDTASGGTHDWFTKPEGVHVGSADLADGIDVRADGGWVVAPGTVTPWGSWTIREGTDVPAPPWPDWLAAKLNGHRKAGNGGRSGGRGWSKLDRGALDPLDLAALEALEALGGHGAVLGPDKEIRVTRPGKKAGASATVGFVAPGVVKVFTDEWAPLRQHRVYSVDDLEVFANGDAPEENHTSGDDFADLVERDDGCHAPGLEEVVRLARAYQDLPDPGHLYVTLGAAATRDLDGESVWLQLVAPASSGKTETIRALDRVADAHLNDVTAAGLLSWRTGKKPGPVGVLSRIGERGLVTFGDLSSLLASSDRGSRDAVFGLLRRAYDGHVTRDLGTAPEQLSWTGRLTVVAAVTGIIDNYAAHNDALGPRWITYRLDKRDTDARRHASRMARRDGIAEHRERLARLAERVVRAAVAVVGSTTIPDELAEAIEDAVLVTCWGRAVVPRHGYGRRDIDGLPDVEEPMRLVQQVGGLARGLLALGLPVDHVEALCRRVALDSMPLARQQTLRVLCDGEVLSTSAVARAAHVHRHVARFQLEELEQIGVVACHRDGEDPPEEEPDRRPASWSLAEGDGDLAAGVFNAERRDRKRWGVARNVGHTPRPPHEKREESA